MAEKTAIENFNKRCQEATVVPKKKRVFDPITKQAICP
jgi:hypothetical protein